MRSITRRQQRDQTGARGQTSSSFIFYLLSFIFIVSWGGIYTSSVQAQGYDIRANAVVVDRKAHWEQWSFPSGTVDIGPDGSVRPRAIRKKVNVVLDAGEFVHDGEIRGGIRNAGSDRRDAARIMDGDLETFWEPSLKDPLEQWWVEVDLGRLVTATRLVVRFAEEGKGDPFLQFKVLTSNGSPAFLGGKALDYVLVGATTKPNKDQRVFEYTPEPTEAASEEWTGRAFQYVRIAATATNRYKAEQVTRERYEAMSPDERGAIEYIWKIAGEERLVTEQEYRALPPEEQGGIRYYRRERPRLAEVEVWTEGDNISLGILERGGNLSVIGTSIPLRAFDGSYVSPWNAMVYKEVGTTPRWGLLTVDLGTLFWVDTIRLITGKGQSSQLPYLYGYEIRGSDGSKAPDGSLVWRTLSPKSREVLQNIYRTADRFEPTKLRYLQFKHLDTLRRTRAYLGSSYQSVISEFQIYGEGVIPEITLVSDLIQLGGSKNITTIEWDADTPLGTDVQIQTRTGDDLREIKHFFDKSGKEITERKYNDLPGFMQGDITSEFVAGSGWSNWSQIYEHPGDPMGSPSPRKYLMIRARLLSNDPWAAPTLRSIAVHFLRPVAKEVVGEIAPDRDVPVGIPQEFELFVRPTFSPSDLGFDDMLVQAPPAVPMDLLGLRLEKGDDTSEDFLPDEEGTFRTEAGAVLQVFRDGADSLWVRLPTVIRQGGPKLIRIRFRATLFLNGTEFRVQVARSTQQGSWQRVDPGNATEERPGQRMAVSVPVHGPLIGHVDIAPNPFTPNGDGVNDRTMIRFSIFKLNTPKWVGAAIYDIGGREVRALFEKRPSAAGAYTIPWDGRDDEGHVVAPGMYMVQIHTTADDQTAQSHRIYPAVVVY